MAIPSTIEAILNAQEAVPFLPAPITCSKAMCGRDTLVPRIKHDPSARTECLQVLAPVGSPYASTLTAVWY